MPVANRRRSARVRVEGLSLGFARARARVLNMSAGGLAVETTESLRVGALYIFRLRLGDEMVRLSCKVRWCALRSTRPDGDDDFVPVFTAGLTLPDPQPAALASILPCRSELLREEGDEGTPTEADSSRRPGREASQGSS